MPSSRASAPPCSGPAPPNGSSEKSRGSCPRSTDTTRMAPTMLLSTMARMPRAAASTLMPSGSAMRWRIAVRARLDIEREAAAEQVGRQVAEREMGVRDGRLDAAAAVADGARHGARALRPDDQRARCRRRARWSRRRPRW